MEVMFSKIENISRADRSKFFRVSRNSIILCYSPLIKTACVTEFSLKSEILCRPCYAAIRLGGCGNWPTTPGPIYPLELPN